MGSTNQEGVPSSHVSTVVTRQEIEEKRLFLNKLEVDRHILPKLQQHQQTALSCQEKSVAIPAIDVASGKAHWPSLYLKESAYRLAIISNIMRDYRLQDGDTIVLWYEQGVLKFFVNQLE